MTEQKSPALYLRKGRQRRYFGTHAIVRDLPPSVLVPVLVLVQMAPNPAHDGSKSDDALGVAQGLEEFS